MEITKSATLVQTTCTKLLANKMATELKNAADAKAASFKIFERIAPRLDGARKRAEAALAQLEGSMKPPAPKDAAAALYAGEIRAALLRMPPAERAKAVDAAITDGDDAFVSAAVTGSSLLTGLGKAEAAALADAWKRRRHAATVARVECLKAALDQFNRVSSLLSGWTLSLFAEQNAAIAAAQESERLAQEAKAAAVA